MQSLLVSEDDHSKYNHKIIPSSLTLIRNTVVENLFLHFLFLRTKDNGIYLCTYIYICLSHKYRYITSLMRSKKFEFLCRVWRDIVVFIFIYFFFFLIFYFDFITFQSPDREENGQLNDPGQSNDMCVCNLFSFFLFMKKIMPTYFKYTLLCFHNYEGWGFSCRVLEEEKNKAQKYQEAFNFLRGPLFLWSPIMIMLKSNIINIVGRSTRILTSWRLKWPRPNVTWPLTICWTLWIHLWTITRW